ncbi:GIY-YIG nuclease family protein [Galbibacter sp. BG1]|uniref:GIY-YIG nuclease family protein n=1 Tax=Galbibacter sp. BG1 TaxID=1170699 RepID=UPI0015B91D08|nr:GIY-YIG nuclease family protein [Galbibacter sp. BG1]QLE01545.1 GIY-YIG nuclease family protein [Galbibacter sp. BG1]
MKSYYLYSILYNFFLYITTNQYRTTLYIGVTNNIQRRLSQHYFDSQNLKKSFAGKYSCFYLVYYEGFETPLEAIKREKELKKWRREKKNQLITSFNPKWETLNNQVV